jgi:hypothetical protein
LVRAAAVVVLVVLVVVDDDDDDNDDIVTFELWNIVGKKFCNAWHILTNLSIAGSH